MERLLEQRAEAEGRRIAALFAEAAVPENELIRMAAERAEELEEREAWKAHVRRETICGRART